MDAVAAQPAPASKDIPRKPIPRLTRRDVSSLMVHLSDLLEAGCPLARALEAVARQAGDTPLGELASRLNEQVVAGESLSTAMAAMGEHFNQVQISMVRAAEAGGFLQETLGSLARHTAEQVAAVRQIRSKLAYPAVLAVVSLASVVFLLTFVVPRFTRMYQAAEQLLPVPTRVLLAVSGFVGGYWIWLLLAAAGSILAGRAMLRYEPFRRHWDAVLLRLPVVGVIVKNWEMSRFAGTMALMLEGGGTVLQSLRLAARVLHNRALRSEIEALASAVEGGEPLSGPMKNMRFFDATAIEMIVVSEATGKLASVMDRLGRQRYRDFQLRVDSLMSLVEPAIILIIGVIVGLTVISLLLPVLLMNTLVA